MKMFVVIQIYVYDTIDYSDTTKVYGVFSSKKLAQEAIDNCECSITYDWEIEELTLDKANS